MLMSNLDPGANINTVVEQWQFPGKTDCGSPKCKSQTEQSEAHWLQGNRGKPGDGAALTCTQQGLHTQWEWKGEDALPVLPWQQLLGYTRKVCVQSRPARSQERTTALTPEDQCSGNEMLELNY